MIMILLSLRLHYLRRKAARRLNNLRVYLDGWAIVHYLFALAVFGPGLYGVWRNPPPLPPAGRALLSIWPLLALGIAWGWAVLTGLFNPAGTRPVALAPADIRLLLPSPLPRQTLFVERILATWAGRAVWPLLLVLLVAGLTAQYHVVAWSQVAQLLLTLPILALGATGWSVVLYTLGPTLRRRLQLTKSVAQAGALMAGAMLYLLASRPGLGISSLSASTGFAPQAPVPLAVDLTGAYLPALLFALPGVAVGCLMAARQEIAIWTDEPVPESPPTSDRDLPVLARPAPSAAFRWKVRRVACKRPFREWIDRFILPVLGAGLVGLTGRGAGSLAAVGAALLLFEGARFLGRSTTDDLQHPERLRRLPVAVGEFLNASWLELSLWLLLPALFVWLCWGAGWSSLLGAPVTAGAIAALVLQNGWANHVTRLSPGPVGPNDSSFAHVALVLAVLLVEYLLRNAPVLPALGAALVCVALGSIWVLHRVHADLLFWQGG